MSRNTRSSKELPGDIHQYMMTGVRGHIQDEFVRDSPEENQDIRVIQENSTNQGLSEGNEDEENVSHEGANGGGVTLQNLVSGLPSDPIQLQTLLMQSMLMNQTQQKENQDIQKKNQELLAQLVINSHQPNERKVMTCPKKRSEMSLEA